MRVVCANVPYFLDALRILEVTAGIAKWDLGIKFNYLMSIIMIVYGSIIQLTACQNTDCYFFSHPRLNVERMNLDNLMKGEKI